MDETIESMQIQLELDPQSICYVDKDKYVENAEQVMKEALSCALSDFLDCK